MKNKTCMYETTADLEREEATIKKFLAINPGCTARKLPRSHHADFAIVGPRGQVTAYVEVKQRFAPKTRFPDYWIGRSRLDRLAASAEQDGVLPILLVQWEDGMGVIDPHVALEHARFEQGGRYDRDDARDVETMARIPYDRFTMIPVV